LPLARFEEGEVEDADNRPHKIDYQLDGGKGELVTGGVRGIEGACSVEEDSYHAPKAPSHQRPHDTQDQRIDDQRDEAKPESAVVGVARRGAGIRDGVVGTQASRALG